MNYRVEERAGRYESKTPRLPDVFIDYVVGLSEIARTPTVWLAHPPIRTVSETMATIKGQREQLERGGIDQLPQPLKTITLGVKEHGLPIYYLVSGIGDFYVDEGLKQIIGDEIGVSGKAMKRAVINPSNISPEVLVGLPPCIVAPLVHPGCSTSFFPGIVLVRRGQDPGYTTIAASAELTLVTATPVAVLAINWWHQQNSNGPFLRIVNLDS